MKLDHKIGNCSAILKLSERRVTTYNSEKRTNYKNHGKSGQD